MAEKKIDELLARLEVAEAAYNDLSERIEKIESGNGDSASKSSPERKLKKGRFKKGNKTYEFKHLRVRTHLEGFGSIFTPSEDIVKDKALLAALVEQHPQLVEEI